MLSRQSGNETDTRPTAMRILAWQAGAAFVIAAVSWALGGQRAGFSALAGAVIGIIANLYMLLKALRPRHSARAALGALFMAQLVKIAVTVVLFLLVARVPGLVWPALLIAYAVTLVVFWWVPLRMGAGNHGSGNAQS